MLTGFMVGDVTVRMYKMWLNFAQCIVLQIVDEQCTEYNQYQLNGSNAEQHLQCQQFQMRQLQQNGQRQNDVPFLFLVLALLLARLCW